eukprot:842655-Prorocentrum_minimum.AAC.8
MCYLDSPGSCARSLSNTLPQTIETTRSPPYPVYAGTAHRRPNMRQDMSRKYATRVSLASERATPTRPSPRASIIALRVSSLSALARRSRARDALD